MKYLRITLWFLIILIVVFLMGCTKKSICGDGIVEVAETMQTCCEDTGCLGKQTCQNHQCVEPMCEECQYLENHTCKYYECCSDSDCNDNNKNTIDKCKNNRTEDARCIFREKEDFAIIESDVPLQYQNQVIEKFYENYGDDYDFLVIYTDFDYSGNIYGGGTGFKPIEGIRQPDYENPMGSKANLRSIAFMGDITKKFEGILEEVYPTNANGILHEIGHYWCCYVHFKDWNGVESDKLLQGGIHWHDQLLDIGTNDPMGGRYSWSEISSGTYKGTDREYIGKEGHFSELTLYLMGLIPKEDVESVKLIVPSSELTYEGNDLATDGVMHNVQIEDIIAIEGERVPTDKESQNNFKARFILWTRDKSQVSDDTRNKVNRMRKMFEEQWFEATNRLSTVSTDLI